MAFQAAVTAHDFDTALALGTCQPIVHKIGTTCEGDHPGQCCHRLLTLQAEFDLYGCVQCGCFAPDCLWKATFAIGPKSKAASLDCNGDVLVRATQTVALIATPSTRWSYRVEYRWTKDKCNCTYRLAKVTMVQTECAAAARGCLPDCQDC